MSHITPIRPFTPLCFSNRVLHDEWLVRDCTHSFSRIFRNSDDPLSLINRWNHRHFDGMLPLT